MLLLLEFLTQVAMSYFIFFLHEEMIEKHDHAAAVLRVKRF